MEMTSGDNDNDNDDRDDHDEDGVRTIRRMMTW